MTAGTNTQFEPFRWVGDERWPADDSAQHRHLKLACRARDVAAGVAAVLELLERDDMTEDEGDEHGDPVPRLLPKHTRSDLLRLALIAARDLESQADGDLMRHALSAPPGGAARQ